MERMGVISKINTSTDWCAGMVVVPKQSGDVRICVDLKSLNKNVLREPHPMPKVDDTLALLAGATIFSKLDANSGFWQIPIAPESQPLTTFITPLGGTNSTSFLLEYAVPQHRMNRILESIGMPGRWYTDFWSYTRGTWSQIISSFTTPRKSWSYPQFEQVWVPQTNHKVSRSCGEQRWHLCRSRENFCNI